MGQFWPHDLVGWFTIVIPTLTVLGWILNIYVKQPLDEISRDLKHFRNMTDQRLDDHEKRIQHIEDTGGY